jgi:hypothetical protein
MSVSKLDLSSGEWVILSEGVTRIVAQPNGSRLWLHIGADQPELSDPGFELKPGDTFELDDVGDFGGSVWAKNEGRVGSIVFTVETGGIVATYGDADYVDADYFTP